MRRLGPWLAVGWIGAATWLGCNAILGNESAVFAPDSGTLDVGAADGAALDDASVDDAADASIDAEDDSGPCVDLDKNPRHCGACKHDCRGGDCVDGGCRPVLLASDLPGPSTIAVDATHVYWINASTGDLFSVPIDGGAKTLLFDGPDGLSGTSLALHGGNVYFGIGDLDAGVVRCSAPACDGGPSYTITNADVPVSVFVTPAGTLYFAETVPNAGIERCQLPCTLGTETFIGPSQNFPDHVVVDPDGVVYWTAANPYPGRLQAQPPGGAPRTVANGPITAVAPAAGEVYYVEEGTGPSAAPLDGGGPRRLRTVMSHGRHFALANDVIYATESQEDFVYACARSGCGDGGVVLARKQPTPRGIVFDQTYIYWANEGSIGTGGQIMRLAR